MVVVYHYSVTVWGCFAAGRLVVIDGTMNSSLQQKTLNKSVQKLESTWVLQLFHGVVLTLDPYFVPMRGFSFTVTIAIFLQFLPPTWPDPLTG